MRLPDLQCKTWRGRFWAVATILLVVLLAAHPELRLLVPLLDAIGLDVLLSLMGLQLSAMIGATLRPLFYRAWLWLVPLFRASHRISDTVLPFSFMRDFARYAIFNWVDCFGPDIWLRAHRLVRTARLGPGNSFKPNSLRGSA